MFNPRGFANASFIIAFWKLWTTRFNWKYCGKLFDHDTCWLNSKFFGHHWCLTVSFPQAVGLQHSLSKIAFLMLMQHFSINRQRTRPSRHTLHVARIWEITPPYAQPWLHKIMAIAWPSPTKIIKCILKSKQIITSLTAIQLQSQKTFFPGKTARVNFASTV